MHISVQKLGYGPDDRGIGFDFQQRRGMYLLQSIQTGRTTHSNFCRMVPRILSASGAVEACTSQ